MSSLSLSIAFLLGSPEISGGTYVIFEHSTRLQLLGHHVAVITEKSVHPDRYAWHAEAKSLRWLSLADAQSEKFDIIIATWWKSPFLLPQLNASHYVYFVQSIESRFFREEDPANHDDRVLSIWAQYCESTYSCNIPVITEAQWIQEYLDAHYNRESFLVRNGIRKDLYTSDGATIEARSANRLRVLVEGPVDVGYKNVPKTIELCRKAGIDEIWLLTSSVISDYPGVNRLFSRVPVHETPAIYRSCDVLVKLSYIEGMFGPPLEMFHCGGTAIVYDVTGHDEYIVHNENSYVVARDDDDDVVSLIKKLQDNPTELARLKQGAQVTAERWHGWQSAALDFNEALQTIYKGKPTNKTYLQKWRDAMEADNFDRLRKREIDRFQERENSQASVTDTNNFLQVYCWAEKDGLEKGVFKWDHYHCTQPAAPETEVEISGFPFWIRIDPSVRIGALEITGITITNAKDNSLVYACNDAADFDKLYIGGTLQRLAIPARALFISYGDDPQIILPAITSGKVGDRLRINIELREMGFVDFYQHCFQHPTKDSNRFKRLCRRFFIKNSG